MQFSQHVNRSECLLGAGLAFALTLALIGCTGQIGIEGQAGGDSSAQAGSASSSGGGAAEGSGGSSASGSGGSSATGSGGSSTSGSSAGGSGGNETEPGEVGNPTIAPTTFECDPSLTSQSPGWRRLTRIQYENTLQDLLNVALGDSLEALDVYSSLAPIISALPDDERPRVDEDLHGTYRRLDQGVAQSHVDNWYEVAARVAEQLTEGDRLTALVGDCATDDAAVDECLAAFVERFGARVLRRPLTDDEVAFHAGFYGDTSVADPAGYADVVAGLLNAPQFLYIVEHGEGEASRENTFELSAFELASRLSYHFWNSMPDDDLWDAAVSGDLLKPAVYEQEVERLFEDPRTQQAIDDFYREWLKLENLARLDQANDVPVFKTFAGDDLPSNMLNEAMNDEVVGLLSHLTWTNAASLDTVFTTQLIFPRTSELANLYQVDPVDAPIEAPQGDRPGLLTRAAFLATGSANTRPIMKGVFIRENILCDHIPSPPANAAAQVPELSPELSTREVVEALTEQPGTVCASCHESLINPLGFVTENYDALGRVRTEQRLFDADGEELGSTAIDTQSVPRVVDTDETSVDDAQGLMSLILESGKAHACLARHYFRYSFGRWEHVVNDGCTLEQMRRALVETGSLSGMLREVALTDEFRQRTFE